MTVIVIGRDDELTGFALAGVKTVVCTSADHAAPVVDAATSPAAGAGLVLLSPWVAQHAARAMKAAQLRKGPPVVTVIPG